MSILSATDLSFLFVLAYVVGHVSTQRMSMCAGLLRKLRNNFCFYFCDHLIYRSSIILWMNLIIIYYRSYTIRFLFWYLLRKKNWLLFVRCPQGIPIYDIRTSIIWFENTQTHTHIHNSINSYTHLHSMCTFTQHIVWWIRKLLLHIYIWLCSISLIHVRRRRNSIQSIFLNSSSTCVSK